MTEEQRAVRDSARRFAESEVGPKARDLDAGRERPDEIVRKLGDLKMMGLAVPEKYGGGGRDHVGYVLALMEISKACASTGAIMFVNNSLYCLPVLTFGSEAQKAAYLSPCASGKKLGCFAYSEEEAGSDPGGIATTAAADGGGWLINGNKRFITNGDISSYALLVAKAEGAHDGLGLFVVELENRAGFRVGRMDEKPGIPAGTAALIFENAGVPKEALLGEPGAGSNQLAATLVWANIGVAAQAVGIGRAVLDGALDYANRRKQFGRPVSAFQAIQWKVADMSVELDASELLTLRAASLQDQKKPYEKEAAMAKVFASDATMRVSIEGVQILGAHGYLKENNMERHMRDAKICQIYQTTNELVRMSVAKGLLMENE